MKWLFVSLVLMAILILPLMVNATILVIPANYQMSGDIFATGGTMFDTTSTCPAISTTTRWYDETTLVVFAGTGYPKPPYPHHHGHQTGYYSLYTVPLAGKTIEGAVFKVYVSDIYADTLTFNSDLLFRFQSDCVSDPLAIADTSCFCVDGCTPDTTVSYTAFAPGDTLNITIPEGKINRGGYTNVIVRSSRHNDFCLLHDEQDVTLSSTSSTPQATDPYLLVTYSEAGSCSCCH